LARIFRLNQQNEQLTIYSSALTLYIYMEQQNGYRKILIFGHSNIGDVVYDFAVVDPLRKNYPSAQIFFVTSPKCTNLAGTVADFDKVIAFDKHGRDKGFLGYLRFISRLRQEKFDLAIILRNMQMYYFLGIPTVLKYYKDQFGGVGHSAEQYLALLREAGIEATTPQFNFCFSESDMGLISKIFWNNSINKGDIVVSVMPFAGWHAYCSN